mmetsp:Transcript_41634/g.114841  ORF Transcript_41634/g.114841 Transcript_41634/m.114841 type:complete len:266 (-) Transcript_41634:109-906(-)
MNCRLPFRRRRASLPALAVVVALAFLSSLQWAFLPITGAAARQLTPRRLGARAALCAMKSGLEIEGVVEPLGSHVLVRIAEAEEMSKGGIILPKQDKPKAGEVVAVGPGEADAESGATKPVFVAPGAKVLYSKYAGSETLQSGGIEHTLIKEDDVLVSYSGDEPSLGTLQMPRGRALVRLLEGTAETDSGILLSQGAVKQSTTVGEVMAVGAGEVGPSGKTIESPVEVGDTVRFRWGDEVELDIGDHKFSVVRTSNCIAKWKASA